MCMYNHSAPIYVLTYGKLKEKLRSLPAIGGWSLATGDNREFSFFFFSSPPDLRSFVTISNVAVSRVLRTRIFFTISARYRSVSAGYRRLILHSSTCARGRRHRLIHSPQFAASSEGQIDNHRPRCISRCGRPPGLTSVHPPGSGPSSERKSSSPLSSLSPPPPPSKPSHENALAIENVFPAVAARPL